MAGNPVMTVPRAQAQINDFNSNGPGTSFSLIKKIIVTISLVCVFDFSSFKIIPTYISRWSSRPDRFYSMGSNAVENIASRFIASLVTIPRAIAHRKLGRSLFFFVKFYF